MVYRFIFRPSFPLIAITKSFAGRPGVDYPILSAVPYTNFYCDEQEYPGFFADMETRCQGEFKQSLLLSITENHIFFCRLALLWHWWTSGLVPLPQWHPVLTGRLRLRLVVQCALRSLSPALRHQCPALSTSQGESYSAPPHHNEAVGRRYLYLSPEGSRYL